MITLKASNKDLVRGAENSFLLTNYASGVTSLELLSAGGFSADDYVLLGEFGQESAEIVQIDSISTNTLTLEVATKFAHSESTRATVIPFNQIRFYHTTTTAYNTDTPLAALMNIQPDSLYTVIDDAVNSTGYGWFAFYNSKTLTYSDYSNYIPYADFAENSLKKIYDNFFGPLSQTEADVITMDNFFTWVGEAVAILHGSLNESNREYNVDDPYTLTTVVGTTEYPLPTDFSEMKSVWGVTEGEKISKIETENIDENNANNTYGTRYFLRGKKIGFSPVPTEARSYILRFLTVFPAFTSLTDTIDLPGNGAFLVNEYLLYKAALPLKRFDGETHLSIFMKGSEGLSVSAHKQDSERDSWGIEGSAMV